LSFRTQQQQGVVRPVEDVEELDKTLELLDSSYEEDDKKHTVYGLLGSKVKMEPSLLSSFLVVKEEVDDDDIRDVYSSLVPKRKTEDDDDISVVYSSLAPKKKTKQHVLEGVEYPVKKRLCFKSSGVKQSSRAAAAAGIAPPTASVVAAAAASPPPQIAQKSDIFTCSFKGSIDLSFTILFT